MSYWDKLFDTEWAQRDDIDALQVEAESAADQAAELRRALREERRRVSRLELTLEALIEVLRERKALTRDEVAVMVQQIDLADGVEDGRIGPDRVAAAPKCHVCGRPVNPRRDRCLYCGEPIQLGHTPPVRTARCARCGTEVPEIDTYFSEFGLICGACHRG